MLVSKLQNETSNPALLPGWSSNPILDNVMNMDIVGRVSKESLLKKLILLVCAFYSLLFFFFFFLFEPGMQIYCLEVQQSFGMMRKTWGWRPCLRMRES